ncbi:hypothetical protein [Planococcus koreensis]|uniref:hypothetical protein n=1 Tax=Planococcus koreensis TaxID=112331 RepID=UPI0039FD951C
MSDKMCNLCTLLDEIDIYSIQYLGWITAISVTIIALTTIIFSQYNERSIEKSNDLSEKIKASLLSYDLTSVANNLQIQTLRTDFNKMIYVLSNNRVYKQTLLLFKSVVYSFSVLWLIGSIGYALDANTFIDKLIIVSSTFVLIFIFIFLPDVLKKFNNTYPVTLDKSNNFCNLNTGISYLKENINLDSSIIIKDFIMPALVVSLDNNRQMELKYNQSLNLSNYNIVYMIKSSSEVIYISLVVEQGIPSVYFQNELKNSISFEGLIKSITDSNPHGVLYISDFFNATYSFNFKKEVNEDKEITFTIGGKVRKTNSKINEIFSQRIPLIRYETGNNTMTYNLIDKNKVKQQK